MTRSSPLPFPRINPAITTLAPVRTKARVLRLPSLDAAAVDAVGKKLCRNPATSNHAAIFGAFGKSPSESGENLRTEDERAWGVCRDERAGHRGSARLAFDLLAALKD